MPRAWCLLRPRHGATCPACLASRVNLANRASPNHARSPGLNRGRSHGWERRIRGGYHHAVLRGSRPENKTGCPALDRSSADTGGQEARCENCKNENAIPPPVSERPPTRVGNPGFRRAARSAPLQLARNVRKVGVELRNAGVVWACYHGNHGNHDFRRAARSGLSRLGRSVRKVAAEPRNAGMVPGCCHGNRGGQAGPRGYRNHVSQNDTSGSAAQSELRHAQCWSSNAMEWS